MGFKREEIEAYIGRVMEGERTTTTTKNKIKNKNPNTNASFDSEKALILQLHRWHIRFSLSLITHRSKLEESR